MSAPIPPTPPKPPELDPVISFTHKLRDKADIIIAAHRVAIAVILAFVAFGAYEGWKWHVAALARLEAQSRVEQTKATNEHALGETWKARAIALTDSVRVDTVTVRKILTHTKVDTLMVPAAPVAAQDGVTYSEAPPLVPLEVVARSAFDSLGLACERVEHDCGAALSAKDSALAHDSAQIVALSALNANTAKQLTMQKRSTVWAKIIWGIGGLILGRAIR